jgi:hypothetical protein
MIVHAPIQGEAPQGGRSGVVVIQELERRPRDKLLCASNRM